MKRIKIIGAGSIGNHLANAAKTMNWDVTVTDISRDALNRTKNQIYPSRYGKWDESIKLFENKDVPNGCYDIIFIGTPPDTHINLALSSLEEKPKLICIEKPLCEPGIMNMNKLYSQLKRRKIFGMIGYDHVVGDAAIYASELLRDVNVKDVSYLEVEIKEHWEGIFNAHPWLNGPKDSYLGFWKRGGGACSEHSHGINLWQYFADILGAGKVNEVSAMIDYKRNKDVYYDKSCFLNVRTEKGLSGRIIQDVVTYPPSKTLKLQTNEFLLEWHCNYKPNTDAVFKIKNGEIKRKFFKKTRADDFINEMKHIKKFLNEKKKLSIVY